MQRRHYYRVGKNPKNVKVVSAYNYDQAATIAARLMFGSAACAFRVWGKPDLNGYFQAYVVVIKNNKKEMRKLGEAFHLQQMDDTRELKENYDPFANLHYVRKRDLR